MNKQMLFIPRANYIAPECEALEMKVEGMVCTSPGVGANGLQGGIIVTGGGVFDGWDD